MSQIFVNSLLEWIGLETATTLERVLWVSEMNDLVVVIQVPADHHFPRDESFKRIREALECSECQVLSHDPFLISTDTTTASATDKARAQRAWEAITDLVDLGPGAMFNPQFRSRWVEQQVQLGRFSKPYLYKILRRYWEGGQTRQALYPRYSRSGARGQNRLNSPGVKRGRPRKTGILQERLPGININESIKLKLVKGAKLFYESDERLTLLEAYDKTLTAFFKIGFEESFTGEMIPKLPPEELRPTFAQFCYWYKKEQRDVAATQIPSYSWQRHYSGIWPGKPV
jgi:putative transposase